MNSTLQRSLLGMYRFVRATRVLDTRLGRRVFVWVYRTYKERLEAGPIHLLRRWVEPGTVVIDVGANIGYFALRFAAWVEDGGKVIALEPEAGNYAELQRAVERCGRSAVVETCQVAVADASGTGFLELHRWHPGDHRLGTRGVAVAVTTLDELLRARGWPAVSLIKIDVQGAEARVLAGAAELLRRSRPVMFIEVDESALRRYGSDAGELLRRCADSGYTIHELSAAGPSPALTSSQALSRLGAHAYRDLLFLPLGSPPNDASRR